MEIFLCKDTDIQGSYQIRSIFFTGNDLHLLLMSCHDTQSNSMVKIQAAVTFAVYH